ncbi:unnamed protein product, partial [Brenthis ino]
MVYACECTHAALSLEARHWLLKRVAGGSGRWAAGEPFRTGDHSGRRADGHAHLRASLSSNAPCFATCPARRKCSRRCRLNRAH